MKRWLVVVLLGTMLLAVGAAILVLDIYRTAPETWWLPILSTASLRFLPRLVRALIFGGIGVGLLVVGIWGTPMSAAAKAARPTCPSSNPPKTLPKKSAWISLGLMWD